MDLLWQRLEGCDPHEAALALLEQLYQKNFGKALPKICRTPRGKPYLKDGSCHFSISHSRRHVFCCISRRPIGIDAEEMDRPVRSGLAERILSPQERLRWESQPDRRAALLRLWVLKEAQAKLTGQGLGPDTWRTDFSPDDPRILEIDGCYVAVLGEENHAF